MKSNNNLFFNSKKALSSIGRLAEFLLVAVTIVLLIYLSISYFSDTTSGGLSDFKLKTIIEKCEISESNCNVISCYDGSEHECDDIEKSTWISFEDYYKKCSNPSLENYDKLNCGVLFEKIGEVIDSQIITSGNYNGPKSDIEIKKLLGNNIELIESFANKYSIDSKKLESFLEVESSSNAFDGKYPTVRFECLRYNKKVEDKEKVSCETDKSEFGNSEDTNKEAFLRALKINREQSLLQSSFGLGQVMGFNYKLAGYNSVEKYYDAMFDEEKQIEAFLNFILQNSVILSELKNSDTAWNKVAYNYNGPSYESNNYDVLLEAAYNKRLS
jgi:hypothetical protein